MRLPHSFAGRLRLLVFISTFGTIGVVGAILLHSVERLVLQVTWAELLDVATLVQSRPDLLATGTPGAGPDTRLRTGVSPPLRVTTIAPDGRVISDTHEQAARMENHGARPEVATALDGREGRREHDSGTLGPRMLFLALPLRGSDGTIVGAVRVALSTARVEASVTALRRVLIVGWVLTGVLAAVMAQRIAAFLSRPVERLSRRLRDFEVHDPNFVHFETVATDPREIQQLTHVIQETQLQVKLQVAHLEEQRHRLEHILMGLEEGVVVADARGRVTSVNPAALRLLGVPAESLLRKRFTEQYEGFAASRILAALAQGGETRDELQIPELDHHLLYRTYEVKAPRPWQDGLVVARVAVINDVTRFRRVDRMRREFVANASHELRTPVAALAALLEVLELSAKDDPEKRDVFLERASREADRLRRLSEDLLDLSRAEDPQIRGPNVPADAVAVARDVCERFEAAARTRQQTLALDAPADGVPVKAGADELARALSNLVDNAIKYTPVGGEVKIQVTRDHLDAFIVVEDDGPGIPPAHLTRIFERFYRVDSARSRAVGGAGLGLAIARHLVERCHGTIQAENRPAGGTRFQIQVPLAC